MHMVAIQYCDVYCNTSASESLIPPVAGMAAVQCDHLELIESLR